MAPVIARDDLGLRRQPVRRSFSEGGSSSGDTAFAGQPKT